MQTQDQQASAGAINDAQALANSPYFREGQRRALMLGHRGQAQDACQYAAGSPERALYMLGVEECAGVLQVVATGKVPTVNWEHVCKTLAAQLQQAQQVLGFYAQQGFDHGRRARSALGMAA